MATTMGEGNLNPESHHMGEQAMSLSYKAVGFAQSFWVLIIWVSDAHLVSISI